MASIGHVAVGMAAARVCDRNNSRPSLSSVAAWSALSLLPDADVVGFSLGVRYADEWGHRGATHSLLFTAAIGITFGLATTPAGRSRVGNVLLAVAVAVSHPLLDILTDGGLGCALFWPFNLTRYFALWRPIPVAPIGRHFLSPSGIFVSLVEIALFSPLIVFALRRGRGAAGGGAAA